MNHIPEQERRESPRFHSALRLLELAGRNPSLGGRELLREILERGPLPEQVERPEPRDLRSALKTPSLDDSDYRTPAEQADWIGSESKLLRDLYERGAEIKGDVLILPAEPHELPEDREAPLISSLSYALQRIAEAEKAAEFHALAQKISGDTADARTQMVVFRIYYDRLNRGARTNHSNGDETLAQTLAEMRHLATEMERLETRESLETADLVAPRNDDYEIQYSDSSRKVRLSEESLRFPAGLPYETRERLVTITLPEVDRRIEGGLPRATLFAAIEGNINRRDGKGGQELPRQEINERCAVAGFLKRYCEERLRDPETHVLNASAEFRQARAEFISATTAEELRRRKFPAGKSAQKRRTALAPSRSCRPSATGGDAVERARTQSAFQWARAGAPHTRDARAENPLRAVSRRASRAGGKAASRPARTLCGAQRNPRRIGNAPNGESAQPPSGKSAQ
jgi:hypothetical protein